jgi:hypothetical protein
MRSLPLVVPRRARLRRLGPVVAAVLAVGATALAPDVAAAQQSCLEADPTYTDACGPTFVVLDAHHAHQGTARRPLAHRAPHRAGATRRRRTGVRAGRGQRGQRPRGHGPALRPDAPRVDACGAVSNTACPPPANRRAVARSQRKVK